MKIRALWLIAAAFLSSPGVVLGAALPIPLGLLSHDEVVTWERDADRYDIVLHNVMPGASYVVSSESTYTPVAAPQVPPPAVGVTGAKNFANNTARIPRCKDVVETYADDVLRKTDEFGVATANRTALATAGDCVDDVKIAVEALTTTAVAAGQPAPITVRVRRKFATTVKVQRLAPGKRDWEIAISTGPGAVWLTMPVLALVHDEGEEWFSQPDPLTNEDGTTEERYRLVREDRGLDVRPGAGVGFFLVPEAQRERNFAHSFMAGFGLNDSKTPLLFMAGYSLLIGDHVTLTLGYSATWEPEQLGRYRGLTHVSENLTQDQITDDELVARPFFSIGIDFDGFDLSAGQNATDPR